MIDNSKATYILLSLLPLFRFSRGEESATATCPCFDLEDVDRLVGKVLDFSHDLNPNSCTSEESSIFDDDKVISMMFHITNVDLLDNPNVYPVGYQAQIDKNYFEYSCIEGDAVEIIDKSQALACIDILKQGCTELKSKICPCYNAQDLLQPIPSFDKERSCQLVTGKRELFGAYTRDSGMQYGVTREAQNMKCINQDGIQDTNAEQYTYCTKLIERTCVDKWDLDRFSCSEGKKFMYKQKKRNWCKWAANKNRKNRCSKKLIARKCPITCTGRCPKAKLSRRG